jgi:3-phenylpropionate/trans-cinnamate dioxygenase ferredoxin subunit
MAEFEKVAGVDEVPSGGRKSIIVDELPALLIRIGGDYYAIEDVCTHDGQPLTEGPIDGIEIACPRHGARFDVTTGRAMCMPATEPIAVYEVEVRDDGVYVNPND